MKSVVWLGFAVAFAAVSAVFSYTVTEEWLKEFNKDTADRIRDHGYTAEHHRIETADNYLISLYRIPHSHKLQNQNERRPAVLLQHGLTSCSDAWILNGPNDALAFNLVDAGYDVWMGNARGTRYSRNNTLLSPKHPYFWRFSWHEIGVHDISAMIDHMLEVTGETSVHYVGHSQGTTVFFVLMSTRPEYNAKISTAHLLAPVAFMSHMTTLMAKYTQQFLGHPNRITRLLDTMEILPSTMFFVDIQEKFCRNDPKLWFMCSNLYFLLNGDDGSNGNMNMTVVEHLNETHPAGASTTQLLHYEQEYVSGSFCQLDYGELENIKRYGQPTPPDYDVAQITANMFFYYSDADELSDPIDVEHLASLLPKEPNMFRVPDPTFTHSDFVFSLQVKEVINDPIVAACNAYEESTALLSDKVFDLS